MIKNNVPPENKKRLHNNWLAVFFRLSTGQELEHDIEQLVREIGNLPERQLGSENENGTDDSAERINETGSLNIEPVLLTINT